MNRHSRRSFLANVGRGMLLAGVGPALAADLSLCYADEQDLPAELTFGKLEPLVGLMQDTPADKLVPALVEKIGSGVDLKTLITAGSLANARKFGGQDYTGYHALMALMPAYLMSRQLPANLQPLPVLKVLHRNTQRMQEMGGKRKQVLRPVQPAELAATNQSGVHLQQQARQLKWDEAERTFAAIAKGPVGEAFNHLQFTIQDEIDVHRIVLAWRSWALLELTGQEFAHTLLRQSVRFCLDHEHSRTKRGQAPSPIRTILPKLLDEYKLLGRSFGSKSLDDAAFEKLAKAIYSSSRAKGAEVAAAALADGISPETVGEALSVASNMLLLYDRGRRESNGPDKPIGSVHGASVGVHACDSANAWRNVVRVSNPRNVAASLIVGAYHTAGQTYNHHDRPYPFAEHLEKVEQKDPDALLKACDGAIRENNQSYACALIHRYGELGFDAAPVFDLMRKYAVSEDGALHAEKYYWTVVEEFSKTRPSLRWQHLTGLARVTASEHGPKAPGFVLARKLLDV